MDNLKENLDAGRLSAAESSKGISSDAIYARIMQVVHSLGLSGKVLDFGAGSGNLSRLLIDSGRFSSVDAADIAQFPGALQDSKLKWLYCDLNGSLPVSGGIYDVVIGCEIIEHLENPRFVAREWFRLLRPGGHLIVSTPNNESWRSILSLIFRGHFAYFTGASYPAHITALVRIDLERILREGHFQQVSFSFTNRGTIPALPTVTWQSVSVGLLKGLRYSDNLVCTARKSSPTSCD